MWTNDETVQDFLNFGGIAKTVESLAGLVLEVKSKNPPRYL